MKHLFRVRLSPAMVVAAVALLVALGGTGVAAVTLAVPRNSIGTLQLRANAVNSSKVRNGSLLRADFRAGQIPAGRRGAAGPLGPQGPQGPQGLQGPPGAAGVATPGYVAQVLSQNSNSMTATTSTSYSNLNNASVTVTVPSGETDQLAVFFSGESVCYGGTSLQRCLLKITVDGNELNPVAGADAYFDNNDNGRASPNHNTDDTFNSKTSGDTIQHAIVRTSNSLSAGSHVVQVQWSTTDTGTAFQLDDWALVVQRIKA